MVKVTLTSSCSVSKGSYDKVEAAYKALKTTGAGVLAALVQACQAGVLRMTDAKSIKILKKHSIVNRSGEFSNEVMQIVKVALRQDGKGYVWVHKLDGRRVSK